MCFVTEIYCVFLKIYRSLPLKAEHIVVNWWVFATSCMVFNTLLILIVSIGEWPRFPCGCIAFGCLQFSGNCFSRLGESPPPPPASPHWPEPGQERSPGVLLVSCEHTQPTLWHAIHTSHIHMQKSAREPAPAPTLSLKNYVHVQLFDISELQYILWQSRKCITSF